GVVVSEDDWFEMRLASGGGFGDPLDRSPELVARDVAEGRFSPEDAASIYGVVLEGSGAPDALATEEARGGLRRERLTRAEPPRRALEGSAVEPGQAVSGGDAQPLQPGVFQRGTVAYAEASGTPLAVAPDHWSDGCAVLVERRSLEGPPIVTRSYLDPATGRSLMVEVVPDGAERSFEVSPKRWTGAR
ncbi:MAG: hypothetical protein ACRDGL_09870, partial [Candidatus Limnocylindrales bacterium]